VTGTNPPLLLRTAEYPSEKRPVLIVGWVPRIVTAIARSLHKNHIAVDVADFVGKPVASRAIRERIRVPDPNVARCEFVARLCALIRENGYDTLIPADDFALAAVTEHYAELSNVIDIACPPPPIARTVLDKNSTLEIARQCGIRVPKTVSITNSREIFGLVGTIPFPWVLKPGEKQQHEELKTCTIATVEEIGRIFPPTGDFSPPMLLQEYCPGVGVGVELLMHQGECVAVFQHRRLKELPYTGGFAVTAVAERPDPNLVRSSRALLRAMHWEGVAMVEYKINPENNEAALMEVNGRYWGTLSLAIAAGVDFPLYQWKLMHGETPDIPTSYAVGRQWRWTAGYVARLHWLLVTARMPGPERRALVQTLRDFPADFQSSIQDSIFESSDPAPAMVELLHDLRYLFLYDLRALSRIAARRRAPR
jgi:predicted ATP-grasp superfamily ATP-dependent carboligase